MQAGLEKEPGSRHRSTSRVLEELAATQAESVSLEEIAAQLKDRGFGILLLFFALPNCIPLPLPGISTLTGPVLVFLSLQLCLGRREVWLPSFLMRRRMRSESLRRMAHYAVPWLRRVEHLVRPRWDAVTRPRVERAVAFLMLIACGLLALPIPLGNLLPGLAVTVVALGLVERDGLLLALGALLTVLAITFVAALLSGYGWLIWKLVEHVV